MKRVLWATDVHLNFLDEAARRQFVASLAAQQVDAFLLGGDIGESCDVVRFLQEIEEAVQRPIYFVLGNHDYYRGSIAQTRRDVSQAAAQSQHLVYLNAASVVELTPQTALVGDDGWGDARLGAFERSEIVLNDFLLIDELKTDGPTPWDINRDYLRRTLNALGDEAADHLRRVLPEALRTHCRVVLLTHVPPFREAAWHEGSYSDDEWLPFFACKAVGDVILEVMAAHTDRQLLVLCGHTHGGGRSQIRDNIEVLTGEAVYREPQIQRIFEIQ
jgi:3',5'-cyclic-AMP phosphodiesterase